MSRLTAVAEVRVVDVTWESGDVIEARDRNVSSAEQVRRFVQCTLQPARAAVARQRVAPYRAETKVIATQIIQSSKHSCLSYF